MPTQRENEIQLVKSAQERGMAPDKIKEVVQAYRSQGGAAQPPAPAEVKPNALGESLKARGSQYADIAKQTAAGTINPLQTGIRTVGTTIGAAGDVIGAGVVGLGKKILPQEAEDAISDAGKAFMESGAGKVVSSAVEKYDQWKQDHPELAKDVEAVGNIASLVPAERVLGVAGKTASVLDDTVKSTAKKAVAETKAKASGLLGPVKNVGSILKSKLDGAGNFAKNAPERLDVTAQAVKREAVEVAREKPVVQKAARSGFSRKEASTIANASPREKFVMRQMSQAARAETAGTATKTSADVAGSFLQSRIKEADAVRQEAGNRLGESVRGLKGEVVSVRQKALARLREELGDVTIDNKGDLNFSRTTLSSADNESARRRINALWNDLKKRDAYQLHTLRKEMFESQGGRTKAAVISTESEDKAIDALRKGIADAVEELSPQYRALNKEYAQIAEPLKNLRRYYKGLENASGDILDERSGLLIRRLTSTSPSGQNLKQAIAEIDDILAQKGKPSAVDLKKLQDFQNILEREYSEIVKDTSGAGQIALGIRKGGAGKLIDMAADFIGEASGNTPAYRRKLLEDLLR